LAKSKDSKNSSQEFKLNKEVNLHEIREFDLEDNIENYKFNPNKKIKAHFISDERPQKNTNSDIIKELFYDSVRNKRNLIYF